MLNKRRAGYHWPHYYSSSTTTTGAVESQDMAAINLQEMSSVEAENGGEEGTPTKEDESLSTVLSISDDTFHMVLQMWRLRGM